MCHSRINTRDSLLVAVEFCSLTCLKRRFMRHTRIINKCTISRARESLTSSPTISTWSLGSSEKFDWRQFICALSILYQEGNRLLYSTFGLSLSLSFSLSLFSLSRFHLFLSFHHLRVLIFSLSSPPHLPLARFKSSLEISHRNSKWKKFQTNRIPRAFVEVEKNWNRSVSSRACVGLPIADLSLN